MKSNIFENIQPTSDKELIDVLFQNTNIVIERIVSYGFPTPDGFWYNQEKNEWLILLTGEAEIEFKDDKLTQLKAGDYLFIPAHQEHRVSYTSKEPNCTWLFFHFK
jgi:cupin 2 domain-containing protein